MVSFLPSLTTLAVGATAFYFIIGAKSLPHASYEFGKLTGKAVGFFGRSKEFSIDMVKKYKPKSTTSPMLREGLKTFTSIQREVQSITMNPADSIRGKIF